MAITTNAQEKQELFKTIWKIADDLRGKVDGWDFKSYVLGAFSTTLQNNCDGDKKNPISLISSSLNPSTPFTSSSVREA